MCLTGARERIFGVPPHLPLEDPHAPYGVVPTRRTDENREPPYSAGVVRMLDEAVGGAHGLALRLLLIHSGGVGRFTFWPWGRSCTSPMGVVPSAPEMATAAVAIASGFFM